MKTRIERINNDNNTNITVSDVVEALLPINNSLTTEIYFNVDTLKIEKHQYTGVCSFSTNNLILIEKIEKNFWGNGSFHVGDLVNDEEWDQMLEEFGDDANCASEAQINHLFGDFQDRLKYFLLDIYM